MSADVAYNLKAWFGLEPLRPSVYMEASMLRAAFKTFCGHEAMHQRLEEVALLNMSLPQAGLSAIPPGWDSTAICSNLYHASKFKGMKLASKAKVPLTKSVYEWRCGKGSGSLQKRIYDVLHRCSGDSWVRFINDKMKVLLDPGHICKIKEEKGNSSSCHQISSFILRRHSLCPQNSGPLPPFTDANLRDFLKSFQSCPASVKTSVFKTLINSWSTTHRYHEMHLWPCIFGCEDCKDELTHYLNCDPMWTLAVSAASLPSSYLSLSPSDRLCLFSNSVSGMRLLAVVSRGYHALKFGHREIIERCIANQEFAELNLIFIKICRDAWRHI